MAQITANQKSVSSPTEFRSPQDILLQSQHPEPEPPYNSQSYLCSLLTLRTHSGLSGCWLAGWLYNLWLWGTYHTAYFEQTSAPKLNPKCTEEHWKVTIFLGNLAPSCVSKQHFASKCSTNKEIVSNENNILGSSLGNYLPWCM